MLPAECSENLDTLDGVDSQIGFHIQVEIKHFLWITGFLADDFQQLLVEPLEIVTRSLVLNSRDLYFVAVG